MSLPWLPHRKHSEHVEHVPLTGTAPALGAIDLARSPRVSTVTFNVPRLDHALVAAVFNDYFGVAVRNACFCAHPYVREMLKLYRWRMACTGIAVFPCRCRRCSIWLQNSCGALARRRTGADARCIRHSRRRDGSERPLDRALSGQPGVV